MQNVLNGQPNGKPADERRQNIQLRKVFDPAYALIEPFLDPEAGWAGHSLEHLAFRVLRENFPDLSAAEVHILVVASHRVFIERNPHTNSHLKRPGDLAAPR